MRQKQSSTSAEGMALVRAIESSRPEARRICCDPIARLTAFRFGSTLAALRFFMGTQLPVGQMIKATREANLHREQSGEPYIGNKEAADFLVKQELLPVTNYLPDPRCAASCTKPRLPIRDDAGCLRTW